MKLTKAEKEKAQEIITKLFVHTDLRLDYFSNPKDKELLDTLRDDLAELKAFLQIN